MMEESQEILLNSLKSFGIEVPLKISSVGEINPSSLFSICIHSLRRLPLFSVEETPSCQTSLPDSIVDRVRICTDVACALKNIGFVGDISFHKFMYPSEEDLYRLVRFLVKRLSETSEATGIAESHDIHAGASNLEADSKSTLDVSSETAAHPVVLEFSGNNEVSVGISNKEADVVLENIEQKAIRRPSLETVCISNVSCGNGDIRQLMDTFGGLKQNDVEQQEDQWDNCRRRLPEGNVILLNSLHLSNPVAEEKLQKLKDIELETESVLCELRNREEEFAKLTVELEKEPAASRSSYVERVKEITKNSRKQDADIDRILKETRELQLESNSLEERLHRSYAVVDEIVFSREAKKDIVSRQAYILLASIHDSFEVIREKILETDRTKREVVDIEPKLATIASSSLDMDKLRTDINALKSENRSLDHGPL